MGESDFLETELKYDFLINQGHCDKKEGFETSNLISLGPQLYPFLGRCDTAVSEDLSRDPSIHHYGAELLGSYY